MDALEVKTQEKIEVKDSAVYPALVLPLERAKIKIEEAMNKLTDSQKALAAGAFLMGRPCMEAVSKMKRATDKLEEGDMAVIASILASIYGGGQ